MITLFRWYIMKTKEIKWKLAFWQFVDKQATELMKNPEQLEKKIMPYLAEVIHSSAQAQRKESAKKDS